MKNTGIYCRNCGEEYIRGKKIKNGDFETLNKEGEVVKPFRWCLPLCGDCFDEELVELKEKRREELEGIKNGEVGLMRWASDDSPVTMAQLKSGRRR